MLVFTVSVVLRVTESQQIIVANDEERLFWVLCMDAFLRPLQGFLNMLVYNRPSYARFRAVYPQKSAWWAAQRACLDPDTPRFSEAPSSREYLQDAAYYVPNSTGIPQSNDKKRFRKSPNSLLPHDAEHDAEKESTKSGPLPPLSADQHNVGMSTLTDDFNRISEEESSEVSSEDNFGLNQNKRVFRTTMPKSDQNPADSDGNLLRFQRTYRMKGEKNEQREQRQSGGSC